MPPKMNCVDSGMAVLLCLIASSLAAPVPESQCVRTQLNNGQVHFRLPQDIIEARKDPSCLTYWDIGDKCVVFDKEFVPPVLSVSPDGVTLDTCHDSLVFRLSCPATNVERRLECSCVNKAYSHAIQGPSSHAHKPTACYEWLATVITMWLLTQ